MDREIVFSVLVILLAGAVLPFGTALALPVAHGGSATAAGRELERAALRRLLLPLAPMTIVVSMLLGWAAAEPENSERLPWAAFVAAVPVLAVWMRAVQRARKALAAPRVRTAAAVGLIHPCVVVAAHFANAVDEDVLEAALAHERAHVRRRDPLRIWLAQIVTDLQWPFPGARERFVAWRAALELARDEEARETVRGFDLAAAVLAAARLERSTSPAVAGISSADSRFELRIHRLLSPVPPTSRDSRGLLVIGAATVLVAGAFFAGLTFGEAVVRHALG